MTYKYLLPLLLIPSLMAIEPTEPAKTTEPAFNLAQEINKVSETADPMVLITTYNKIIPQIGPNESIRLSKKLVKLIKNLHTLCSTEKSVDLKLAYKTLLETAIANPKIAAVDYAKELAEILTSYTPKQNPAQEPPVIIETPQTPQEVDKQKEKDLLKDKVKLLDRNSVFQTLAFRKIMLDITKLTNNLQTTQNKVIKEQEALVERLYKKMIVLEKLLKQSPDLLTRAPNFEIDESSPLLQKIIAEDMSDV